MPSNRTVNTDDAVSIAYEGQYKKKCLLFLFSINYTYNCIEIYTYHWYNLHKVQKSLTQSLLHYQHTFLPLREALYARSVKLFLLNRRSSSHTLYSGRCRPQNGALGVHPSRVQKDGCRKVLNSDCTDDDDSVIYMFGRILRIRRFNFFNVCA